MNYNYNQMSLGGNNMLGYNNIPNIDYATLNRLGFKNDEINDVCTAIKAFGKADKKQVVQAIQYSGTAQYTDHVRLNKLMYLSKIIERKTNRTSILDALSLILKNTVCSSFDTDVEEAMNIISLHYAKMFRDFHIGSDKFTNRGLGQPKLRALKSLAVVANVRDPIFEIYNSDRYVVKERFYTVLKKGSTNITLLTDRTPVLQRGQEAKVKDVGEIKVITNKQGEREVNLVINNRYVGILNRFVIAASTRRPQIHCGMVEMICKGGTRLYVYALEYNESDSVNGGVNYRNDGAGSNSAKVFDYGFNGNELENKLINVANAIYSNFDGIIRILIKPEHKFITKAFKVKSTAEKVAEQRMMEESKF